MHMHMHMHMHMCMYVDVHVCGVTHGYMDIRDSVSDRLQASA
jgi:hypothetical protein